jgi:hypothetical protein
VQILGVGGALTASRSSGYRLGRTDHRRLEAARTQRLECRGYVEGADASCRHERRGSDGDDAGPTAVHVGHHSVVQANTYAPNGTVWLKARTTATGAFVGKRVRIGEQVELTLDSAFR